MKKSKTDILEVENMIFLSVSDKDARDWRKIPNLWPVVFRRFSEWLGKNSHELKRYRSTFSSHIKLMDYCWKKFETHWKGMRVEFAKTIEKDRGKRPAKIK